MKGEIYLYFASPFKFFLVLVPPSANDKRFCVSRMHDFSSSILKITFPCYLVRILLSSFTPTSLPFFCPAHTVLFLLSLCVSGTDSVSHMFQNTRIKKIKQINSTSFFNQKLEVNT